MQTNTAFHLVAIALAIILVQVGELMLTLPEIVSVLLLIGGVILLIIGILGLTGTWNKLISKSEHRQPKIPKISPIERIEHGKKPSVILSYLWIMFFSLVIILGSANIYGWFAKTTNFDISKGILIPISIISSMYCLMDMFVIRRKYYKLSRSNVVSDMDFIVDGNINKIFDDCRRIILTMIPTNIRAKPPKLLKAHLAESKIIVEISHRRDSRVNVYVVSDAFCVTTRHDNGDNQKNIDTFMKLFYQSFIPAEQWGSLS